MPRPLLAAPTAGPRHTLAAMGDSLTHNATYGVPVHLLWPEVLAASLRASGYRVRGRNFAKNGNTTTQMLVRMPEMTRYDVPKIGLIFAGVNDPGAAISTATTQANIESMAATLYAAGTRKLVVVSPQFLNYTSGGEATSGSKPTSTYGDVWDAQVAAVAAINALHSGYAVHCELWTWMKYLIVGGTLYGTAIPITDTLASASWHVAGTNQHLNTYGHTIVAAAVSACILAQSGWGTALTGN